MDKITDKKSLEKWLEARPEETRQKDAATLAHRTAMRLVPFALPSSKEMNQSEYAASLPIPLRQQICLAAFLHVKTAELENACLQSALSSFNVFERTPNAINASNVSRSSVGTAINDTWEDTKTALSATLKADLTFPISKGILAAQVDSDRLVWQDIEQDNSALSVGHEIAQAPLWSGGAPEWIAAPLTEANDWLARTPGYDFWLRWYEAALAGQPLTGDWESHWALLRDIALIPDADWKRGAKHVAGLIEIFEEKHRLKQEFSDWKRRLDDEIYNRQTLGHHRSNLPDDFPEPLVWQYESCQEEAQKIFEDAEEAFDDAIPDPEKLFGILDRLSALWKRLSFLGKCATASGFVLTAFFGGIAAEAGADFYHVAKPAIMRRLETLAEQIKQRPVAPKTPAPKQTGWDEPPLEL